MLGPTRYKGHSATMQQSKEEPYLSEWSLERTELRHAEPPPVPYNDAPRSRRTKVTVPPTTLGLGDHYALALSPPHPGPSSSHFSTSPAESDSEQEVVKSTQARWNFDSGSDCEPPHCKPQCYRTTSSNSCDSQESTAYASSSDEMETQHTLNTDVWPSMGSVGHPHMCGAPCKFAGKNRCKDGESCTRCHMCIWTRAQYRERAGANRTLEMRSV